MQTVKRLLAAVLCIVLLTAGLAVSAAESDEISSVTWETITGDGFVADSLYGVDACYNLTGPTLYCTEYVTRFYQQVYGVSVLCGEDGPSTDTTGYWFEKTATPSVGDIVYASAERRGKSYGHWAIVKSVGDGTMTLIEQNWSWNGEAGINRVISYPSDYYEIYTLRCADGVPTPVISLDIYVTSAQEQFLSASDWARSSLLEAALSGYTIQTADFQKSITRDQFCQLAVELLKDRCDIPYTPVRSLTEQNYCAVAYDMGLLSGSADGSLMEDSLLDREQAATIFNRLAELAGLDESDKTVTFNDQVKISSWAQTAVSALSAKGILKGDAQGNFNPNAQMTYEEAVVIIMRMTNLLQTEI